MILTKIKSNKLIKKTIIFFIFFVLFIVVTFMLFILYLVKNFSFFDNSTNIETFIPSFQNNAEVELTEKLGKVYMYFKKDIVNIEKDVITNFTLVDGSTKEEIQPKITLSFDDYYVYIVENYVTPDCIAIYKDNELFKNVVKNSLDEFPKPSDFGMCEYFDFENALKT